VPAWDRGQAGPRWRIHSHVVNARRRRAVRFRTDSESLAGRTRAAPSAPRGAQDRPTPATSGRPSARTIDPSKTASRGSGSPAAGGYRPCASTGQAGRRIRGTGRRARASGSWGARVDRCRSRTYVAPQSGVGAAPDLQDGEGKRTVTSMVDDYDPKVEDDPPGGVLG
jgi:hypothetical protein